MTKNTILIYETNPTVEKILSSKLSELNFKVHKIIPDISLEQQFQKHQLANIITIIDVSLQPSFISLLPTVIPKYVKDPKNCIITSIFPAKAKKLLPKLKTPFFQNLIEKPFKMSALINHIQNLAQPDDTNSESSLTALITDQNYEEILQLPGIKNVFDSLQDNQRIPIVNSDPPTLSFNDVIDPYLQLQTPNTPTSMFDSKLLRPNTQKPIINKENTFDSFQKPKTYPFDSTQNPLFNIHEDEDEPTITQASLSMSFSPISLSALIQILMLIARTERSLAVEINENSIYFSLIFIKGKIIWIENLPFHNTTSALSYITHLQTDTNYPLESLRSLLTQDIPIEQALISSNLNFEISQMLIKQFAKHLHNFLHIEKPRSRVLQCDDPMVRYRIKNRPTIQTHFASLLFSVLQTYPADLPPISYCDNYPLVSRPYRTPFNAPIALNNLEKAILQNFSTPKPKNVVSELYQNLYNSLDIDKTIDRLFLFNFLDQIFPNP